MIIRAIKLGLALMLAITTGACAGLPGLADSSWKEEVQLQDGNKIIVSRSVVRGGRHEPFQQSPIYSQDLSFVIPTTNEKVTWEDKFSEDIGSANFLPMMLEIDQDIAYLVVNPMGCLSYNKWGRPNPPYVVFQYQDKAWNRISLEELPDTFKTPNLIFSSPDETAKKLDQRVVSSETIKALYASYSQPVHKTILRETVSKGGGTSCEVLERYKCGWGAPGDFNREYFERVCK